MGGCDTTVRSEKIRAFTANEGRQQTAESSRVLVRGGTWDNVLNTNNTITFTAADIDDVVGSNT